MNANTGLEVGSTETFEQCRVFSRCSLMAAIAAVKSPAVYLEMSLKYSFSSRHLTMDPSLVYPPWLVMLMTDALL